MKSILCFGDSNTWGYQPGSGERYDFHTRWPGVFEQALGSQVRVVEEGMNGRMSAWDDPLQEGRNSRKVLPVILKSHSPLDLAIIMLGTNDLKVRINLPTFAIAEGVASLVELCQNFESPVPEIILVSPILVQLPDDPWFAGMYQEAHQRSKELAQQLEFFAKKLACHFFDAATVAKASSLDGVHLEAEQHLNLGRALAGEAKRILSLD